MRSFLLWLTGFASDAFGGNILFNGLAWAVWSQLLLEGESGEYPEEPSYQCEWFDCFGVLSGVSSTGWLGWGGLGVSRFLFYGSWVFEVGAPYS